MRQMLKPLGTLWAVVLVAAGGGCARGKDTPEHAYAAFVRAVQKDEEKTAFAALSEPTRQALTEQARAISQGSGGAISPDPAKLAVVGARPAPTHVETVSNDGQRAVLKVTAPDLTAEVTLVKEFDGWHVALPAPLHKR